ncbi:NAD(P)H dehydrogenase subunit NdhS [Synechococcus sp. PCC 7336]|uniref:NAD(P)H dehydrogenase subunit NdhS n=1 Tax=Synechococcus sp. PCC 7336 TaxID=195250 RepID=UPI000346DB32
MSQLLLPGQPVKVINPNDTYFRFQGQVQRVVDGKAAVIFGGGNWEKIVTFNVDDLRVCQ